MSNRENLRRIAALSLVIAFGMSGAAGLANEQETGEIVAPASRLVFIEYDGNGFTEGIEKQTYSTSITIPADKEEVIFELAKEWKFTDVTDMDNEFELETAVKLDGNLISETDGHYDLKFTESKKYVVVISADDVDGAITIEFNVTKEQKPVEEKELTVVGTPKVGSFTETGTNIFEYDTILKLDNGTATAEFAKFWTFKLGDAEITDFELPEGLTVDETSGWYSVEFKEDGKYTFEIKAKDSDGKPYDAPTITLVFNVSPEETVHSTIAITDDTFGGVFSNEDQPENTYKYTGKFETDAEGKYTADFSSFWKFVVGENEVASVTTSDGITPNEDDTYTFTAKDFGEHKVTFYAEGHNDFENDAILTLVFDIAKPEEVIPEINIDDSTRGFYFDEGKDKYTYNYSSEYYDSLANPYTVDFKEFWTFNLPDAADALNYTITTITDEYGNVIKPVGVESAKPGETKGYTITFHKTGKYAFKVKALKADGTAYDAPVITLNFDIKSDIPELTIYDEKADGFTIDDTTCTYKLTLDEAGTPKDVEFTKFWQFDLNGKDLNGKDLNVKDLEFDLPKDIKYTGAGYKVSFDKAGEYTYEIKAIKPAAEGETEAVIYEAPVLTLKFIVTKARRNNGRSHYRRNQGIHRG